MTKRQWRVEGWGIGILCFYVGACAFSNFTNYQSNITVNDITVLNNKVWAASSGGLFCIDLDNNSQTFYADGDCFPDLNLTALTQDSKGNLWIGSKRGYLYKRSGGGDCSVYDSYNSSGWDITDICSYKDYIFVASSKGCSIFDPGKGAAIRNTTSTDTSGDPTVNAIAVHNDSLYVGCNKGFNAANVAGRRLLDNIYNDMSIWNSTRTDNPIVAFVDSSGKFLACDAPAAKLEGLFFHCVVKPDSFELYYSDTLKLFAFPGKVTSLCADQKMNLWIGTTKNYLMCWTAQGLKSYIIPGPTLNIITRIHVARNGIVWLLPEAKARGWWEGVTTFNNKQWYVFNQFSVPDFGNLIDGGSKVLGLCEDRNGDMWIGTPGANVKFFGATTQQWSQYYVAGYECDSIRHSGGTFGWQDAIAQDSSGYMWFSNYDPVDLIKTGPLICYDPSSRYFPNFRRFFPDGNEHHAINLNSICVDAMGKIIASTSDGRLLVVRHNGKPTVDGVTVELDQSDIGAVDICSTPGGNSWIASGKGLFQYKSNDNSLILKPSIPAITCVEAENENTLWLGTSSNGLIRYDVERDSITARLDMSKGLVSNEVNDLSIDRKGGNLWVGTNGGVSRYYLGHSDVPVTDNKAIVAYPNPFSLSNSNHRRIVFKHCPPDARVLIYTVNGTLVQQLSLKENSYNSLIDNALESTLYWVPSKKLAPGAYYFVGYPRTPATAKKLLIVP